ncbi:unnamed protein product, partial [Iphiclides podalirius]
MSYKHPLCWADGKRSGSCSWPCHGASRPGRVAAVISRAQHCNHASVARASARTHRPRGTPPSPAPEGESPEQTDKKERRTTRTPLTTRPVLDAVWEDLANLNFDRLERSIHQRN